MAYVTRSGRRIKKVNYSDNPRSKRAEPTEIPEPGSEQREVERMDEDDTKETLPKLSMEPPLKKQKVSGSKSLSTYQSPIRKRRRRRKPDTVSTVTPILDIDSGSEDGDSHKNCNHNHNASSMVIPPLPSLEEIEAMLQAEDSGSDLSDLEILAPTSKPQKQKKVLPTLSPQKTMTPKKKKIKKSPKKKEKRRASKRRGSQKFRDRLARAKVQRIYMVDATIISEHEREYKVLGSTGNVYTISIGTLHSCDCPDFRKRGDLCKHIIFVLLKVLRVSDSSSYIYQTALLTDELEEVFSAAPQTLFGSVLANAAVRGQYLRTASQSAAGRDFEEAKVERKALEGDCPVCMEEIDGEEATTWCRAQCGNNIHTDCFKEWSKSQQRAGGEVLCMFCRCVWQEGPEDAVKGGRKRKKVGGRVGSEGYLNFAAEQGMSGIRDTSSYSNYNGPRRGWKRRGWGWY